MGQGRAGFYTYEWIENALGAKIRTLDHIDPDLQSFEIGDRIRLTPEIYLRRVPGQYYRVKGIRPDEALVLLQELPTGGLTGWSFTLRAAAGGHTRLLVRSRTSPASGFAARLARQLELLLLEPGYFIMERGMLRGIGRRAESLPAGFHARRTSGGNRMTLVWFVIWLIANNVGGGEPLTLDPVNGWTGTLILAVALNLSPAHARGGGK